MTLSEPAPRLAATDQRVTDWILGFTAADVFYAVGLNVSETGKFAAIHKSEVATVVCDGISANVHELKAVAGLRTTVLPIAVLDTSAVITMHCRRRKRGGLQCSLEGQTSYLGNAFEPQLQEHTISLSLDRLITQFELAVPTRLRISVNGYESRTIAGAWRSLHNATLRDVMVQLVVSNGLKEQARDTIGQLRECGFDLVEQIDLGGKKLGAPATELLFRRPDKARPADPPVEAPPERAARAMARGASRMGAVSFVRNGIDILPFICGHYLRLGFSRLLFQDDGSSDGTYELLKALSRRDARVEVERVAIRDLAHGREVRDAAANQLIEDGISVIMPFDQDEFWNLNPASMDAVCAAADAGLLTGRFVQFVMDARVRTSRFLNPFLIRHRTPALYGSAMQAVQKGKPFLCYSKPKVAIKSLKPVALASGNHTLLDGPSNSLAADLEVFHLPFRSRAEVEKRTAQGRFPHWHLHGRTAPEQIDAFWSANSAHRDGCLHPPGEPPIMLIPDRRLCWTLVKAWRYMAARHPLLLARSIWNAREGKTVFEDSGV